MLYWNEFKWNYNIPVECLSIRISGLSGRESTETRQGVSWNWPYLKLCHRNSRLSTKSGHQGGEGGCARDLSMNTLLWEGPPGITFWKWDRLPWASWAWQSAFFEKCQGCGGTCHWTAMYHAVQEYIELTLPIYRRCGRVCCGWDIWERSHPELSFYP